MSNKGQPKRVFTPAEDEHITVWRGKKTADEIGPEIDRSADAVRRRWRVLGLADKRAPKAVPGAPMSATDAEAVATYLHTRSPTMCEPGTAAGLSSYERLFHAARPQEGSLREQNARWIANRKKRGVA